MRHHLAALLVATMALTFALVGGALMAWRIPRIEQESWTTQQHAVQEMRSRMELLDDFGTFAYPNQIGPGVYDIHSPNIPTQDHIVQLMKKAAERIPAERLWVNPDCGLKTRQWAEVIPALANMVSAARLLRETA